MKRILQAFALAAIAFLAASPALAQTDTMPVEIVKPAAWQATETGSADKDADWVDPKTENRIEIRTVRIVRDEHASTLREAFEAQLLENRFKRTADTQQRSIPLVNATKRTGFWSEYEFTGAEVPISVVTFEFTIAGTVVYVIGYFARTNRAEGIEAMQSVISQMVDKS